jgi:Initiator Replication protein
MPFLTTKEKNSPQAIKTPQALIHIKHRISLLQYKYWILLLRELKEQFESGALPDENGFRYVSMQKIADDLGYVPNKAEIFKDFLALKNETIAFNVLEKDGKEAKYGAGFISEWKITNQRIAFKFPSMLENVVRGLEEPKAIFQLLNWSIFNHFSGKYEAVIYKLCKDFVGVSRTPYITLQEFRDYMGLKPTEYLAFKDLNRNVISGPCTRINESDLSDISVEVDLEKEKRVVIGLRFLVKRKNQSSIPFPELEASPAFRFAKVHIEPATQQEYLAIRPPEEIELCIDRANEYGSREEKSGKSVSYGALYRKAVTDGWHTQQVEKRAKEDAEKERQAAARKEAQRVKELEKQKIDEETLRTNSMLDRFDTLPEEKKSALRQVFREQISISLPALRKSFDAKGERGAMHRAAFAKFIETHINES